jgi:hypothetical protein
MRAPRDSTAHPGRTSARWRGAVVVVAAAALSLVTGAVPASAAAGPAVIGTITVSSSPANRPVPVVTLTSSNNPSTFGQQVTFTATVTLRSGCTTRDCTAIPPGIGTVTFSNGDTVICSAVPLTLVSGRTYQGTCTTAALPGGPDTITAAYPGNPGNAPSSDTFAQTVDPAPTALTASIGVGPRRAPTLTATLTASGGPVSGQPVSVSTGSTQLCAPDTSTSGVATCPLTGPQVHLIEQARAEVSYPGNTDYLPASVTVIAPPWLWWWWPGP